MEITWLGHSCFRLKGKTATLLTDPYAESVGYTLGRLAADIVTVSCDAPDHNNWQAVQDVRKVIRGPGEYEIANVTLLGAWTLAVVEKERPRLKNTAYVIDMDGLRLCHLGDIAQVPAGEQVAALGKPHILFVPVGGNETLDGKLAAECVRLLEPNIVIPMHYKTPAVKGTLETVEKFLKEMGVKDRLPQPRLSVTPSNLPGEMQVVVLDYPH